MSEKIIKYIPKEIVIGLQSQDKTKYYSKQSHLFKGQANSLSNPAGIVVCNFGGYKWTNDSGFKYVTGYNRGNYRDYSKSIQRDLEGVVFNSENTPTTGFKILDEYFNVYSETGAPYTHNFPILDPRGFVIGLSRYKFIELINNVEIKNGVIQDPLIYCWEDNNSKGVLSSVKFPYLISVNSNEYKEIEIESRNIENTHKPCNKFKSKKDLIPGKIYTISDSKSSNGKTNILYLGKKRGLNSAIFNDLTNQYYVEYNPFETDRLLRLKKDVLEYKNKVSVYNYGYYNFSVPWQNTHWQDFISDKYLKLYEENNYFLILDDNILKIIKKIFNNKCLIDGDIKSFNKHIPIHNIRDIFSNGIKTNIQLNKILEEKDLSEFEDFQSKEFYNYIMNITEKLMIFVKNSMNIILKNFPVTFSNSIKSMGDLNINEINNWYKTPYLPCPFHQDC